MDVGNLTKKKCVPCEGNEDPMSPDQIAVYKTHLRADWQVIDDKKIQRQYKFKDFKEAMDFVNTVAEIAESEGHHPDIFVSYNKVTLTLSTHAIGGLSENDFILAAKIDE